MFTITTQETKTPTLKKNIQQPFEHDKQKIMYHILPARNSS